MSRDHLLRFDDRREVVRAIPLAEQREVRHQPRWSVAIEVDPERASARGQNIVHALRRRAFAGNSVKPRFRWTSSSAMAAGVTPDTRAACPMVSGRC